MVRIQYKQIERIAQQCNVTATRAIWPGEVDSPAVRLSGFLSDIQTALLAIHRLPRAYYFEGRGAGGVYLVRMQ